MSPNNKLIYLLFFLSGIAGLIYEIVWGRLLVLIFGSTTNSQVAVISAFLGGLALGSLISGRVADRLTPKKLIRTYSILEFSIGVTALLSLPAIDLIKIIYGAFSDGSSVTFGLILAKFFLSIIILIIPTTLMGATLPILVKFLQGTNKSLGKTVSYLYSVNTFGAMFGVLISAFILIEILGLMGTIILAAVLNFAVAVIARAKIKNQSLSKDQKISLQKISKNQKTILPQIVIFAFFLSGLIAIAYEVLWTRILTPTVGTFIYAFATILAIYLLGIALGSILYDRVSKPFKSKMLLFALCEFAIGFFALVSVYLTSNQIVLADELIIILVLLPATIIMGLTFPVVVEIIGLYQKAAKTVGISYFANTIGSILGGFLASFFLLNYIGSSQSIILLSILNFLLAFVLLYVSPKNQFKIYFYLSFIMVLTFTVWLYGAKRNSFHLKIVQWRIDWANINSINYSFMEDEVASVFAYSDSKNKDQNLFIDGVPTTGRVIETKLMADIPILLHQDPKDILIICFGMGNTYRTSLLNGVNADAVELVPSVPKMFSLFHDDSAAVMANPKGRIIINDGRNYVFLTDKKYDIVTIDPPPPFNAAGTTVLYSQSFYGDIAKKLKPGGIVSQWMWFGSREDDIAMAIKSFTEIFPYVLVFKSPSSSSGLFLEGSFAPINIDEARFAKIGDDSQQNRDLKEFSTDLNISQIKNLLIGDRQSLLKIVGKYSQVTDNFPRTEYFLLRHTFTKSPDLTKSSTAQDFIDAISINSTSR